MIDDIEYMCYDNRSCRYEDLIDELKHRTAQLEAERDAMRADMIVCVSDARKMAADLYRAQNERDEAIAFSRGQQTIINEQRRQLEQAQRKIDSYDKAERALNKALNEGDGVYRP